MTDGDSKRSDQFKTMILLSFSGRLWMTMETKGCCGCCEGSEIS